MAGHPTVGSTFALAHTGFLQPGGQARGVRAQRGADPGEYRMGGRPAALCLDDTGTTRSSAAPIDGRSQVATSLGLTHNDLAPTLPHSGRVVRLSPPFTCRCATAKPWIGQSATPRHSGA